MIPTSLVPGEYSVPGPRQDAHDAAETTEETVEDLPF